MDPARDGPPRPGHRSPPAEQLPESARSEVRSGGIPKTQPSPAAVRGPSPSSASLQSCDESDNCLPFNTSSNPSTASTPDSVVTSRAPSSTQLDQDQKPPEKRGNLRPAGACRTVGDRPPSHHRSPSKLSRSSRAGPAQWTPTRANSADGGGAKDASGPRNTRSSATRAATANPPSSWRETSNPPATPAN